MYCETCDRDIPDDQVVKRIEDDTFTAPYGDTFVDGGGKYEVFECPDCGAEVEGRDA